MSTYSTKHGVGVQIFATADNNVRLREYEDGSLRLTVVARGRYVISDYFWSPDGGNILIQPERFRTAEQVEEPDVDDGLEFAAESNAIPYKTHPEQS